MPQNSLTVPVKRTLISPKLRFAGDRSVSNTGTFTPVSAASAAGGINVRSIHVFVNGIAMLCFDFYGWTLNGSGVEIDMPNPYTVAGYVGLGVRVSLYNRVTFNGAATGTVVPGARLRSDPMPIAINGTDAAPVTIFADWYFGCASGASLPYNVYYNGVSYPNTAYSNTSAEIDQTANLSYLPIGGNYALSGPSPNAVLGYQVGTRKPVYGSIGDSIDWGLGNADTFGVGYPGQLFNSPLGGITGAGAYANGGEPSSQLAFLAIPIQARTALQKTYNLDVLFIQSATNDFAQGTTFAQFQASFIAFLTQAALNGVKFFIVPTVLPRCTTTDSGVLDTNMTPQAGWGVGGSAQLWNGWLRDGMPMTGAVGTWAGAATGSTANGVMRSGRIVGSTFIRGAFNHPLYQGFVLDVASSVESTNKVGVFKSAADGTTATALSNTDLPNMIHPSKTAMALMLPYNKPLTQIYNTAITPYLDA